MTVKKNERRIPLSSGLTLSLVETRPTTDSDAPPLICLHGFLEQAASWTPIAERLGRHVIAVDQRGFGRSDHIGPGGFYHFWDYVSDLDLLLENIAPDSPIDLLGHSMGGTVACLYAGCRPERIRKLVLVEGLGPPDDEAGMVTRARLHLRHRRVPPSHRTIESVESAAIRMRRFSPKLDPDVALQLAERVTRPTDDGVVWTWDARHRMRSPRPFVASHFTHFLAEITAPVLVVWGDSSPFPGIERADHLTASPDVRIVRIEGAGHMVHHDAPEVLAKQIDAFLA